jgi:hypothetical protein
MSNIPTSNNNCVALSPKLDAFDNIFVGDTEYRLDSRGLPIPVGLVVIEMRSGEELVLDRRQLLALRRLPFDGSKRSLFVAFNASAEMLSFLQLGLSLPVNVIDPFILTAALTNGSKQWPHRKFRPGLLTALQLFGLRGIESEEKKAMVELILSKDTYTPEEWTLISTYCRSDVVATCALLLTQIDQIDLHLSLHWGRFMKTIARQEQLGLPVDTLELERFNSNWPALKLDAIRRYGVEHFYDGTHFVEQRLEDYVLARGWVDWPRTPTGKLETKQATIGRQAELHPELQPLAHVRSALTDLRLSNLINSVGSDGYARCALRPFHTITGRNQPQARDRIFLPALPSWLHGLLKPPLGFALLELDWATQEVGIMAALSGDPNMIADYMKGDCHTAFAVRAALIDTEIDEETRAEIRNKQAKPVVLGSNYGMTAYGIRAKTKRSLDWCRHIYRQHHVIYSVFHSWLDDVVTQARFDQHIESVNGWPLCVHGDTSDGTLLNFPAQSGGADMMRHAAIASTEQGIPVCCSVHDSFKVLAPIGDVERISGQMDVIMRSAGAVITGSFEIPAELKSVVCYPDRQASVWTAKDKGLRMWVEIQGRLGSGELPEISQDQAQEDQIRDDEDAEANTSKAG